MKDEKSYELHAAWEEGHLSVKFYSVGEFFQKQ